MQSSKRTLRSHEIQVAQVPSVNISSTMPQTMQTTGGLTNTFGSSIIGGGVGGGGGVGVGGIGGNITGIGVGGGLTTNNAPLFETDLDLHFSLQYPHFIKRDGNRCAFKLLS